MDSDIGSTTETGEEPLSPETTVELLELAKEGDPQALERLLERCPRRDDFAGIDEL